MFNNKRTDSTYLKIKDGKVINTPNPYPTDEDKDIELQETDFYEHNKIVEQEEVSPKNKKSKFILFIGLLLVIIPLSYIGFNLTKSYVSQLQTYMILGKDNSDTNSNTTDTNSDKDEIISVNKENISSILEVTNMVNTSFKTSYNGLKTDIILFAENKESVLATKNKLKSRELVLKSNNVIITNKKALFVKNKQQQLYDIYIERFDLISKTINTLKNDINRTNAVELFNNALIEDNVLLDKEILLLKELLNDNNIEFTETTNGIEIKE